MTDCPTVSHPLRLSMTEYLSRSAAAVNEGLARSLESCSSQWLCSHSLGRLQQSMTLCLTVSES